MRLKRPSDAEIYDQIMGAMGLAYPWWELMSIHRIDESDEAEPGWWMCVRYGLAGEGGVVDAVLDADKLWSAARRIADEDASYVSDECTDQCVKLCVGLVDHCDFDSDSADQVMQVAVTGSEATYG